jgi:PAS domain S-box-containing protein
VPGLSTYLKRSLRSPDLRLLAVTIAGVAILGIVDGSRWKSLASPTLGYRPAILFGLALAFGWRGLVWSQLVLFTAFVFFFTFWTAVRIDVLFLLSQACGFVVARKLAGNEPWLSRERSALAFLAGASLAQAVPAFAWAAIVHLLGGRISPGIPDAVEAWLRAAAAILAIVPVILVNGSGLLKKWVGISPDREWTQALSRAGLVEACVEIAAWSGVLSITVHFKARYGLNVTYLTFLPPLTLALLRGMPATALALAGNAIAATTLWQQLHWATVLSAGDLRLLILIYSATILVLAAVVDERQRSKGRVEELLVAEAVLRESEKHFRTLADSAPVMIWMSGTDKLCTFVNKPWLDFTGRSIEEELGPGWAEGLHPEDREDFVARYGATFDARQSFEGEGRFRRFGGDYRLLLVNGVAVYRDGQFTGYIGSCTDITERRLAAERARAEALLRESEQRHALLLMLTDALRPLGDAISIQETACGLLSKHFALDSCVYVEFNPSGEIRSVEGACAKPGLPALANGLCRQDLDAALKDRLRGGQNAVVPDAFDQPLLASTPLGADVPVDVKAFIATPVIQAGRLQAVLVASSTVVRNWTRLETELMAGVANRVSAAVERASAEAQLRIREERLRLAAHAAKFGIYEVDLAGNAAYWSPEFREIAGVPLDTPSDLPGPLPEFVHPEDRSRVEAACLNAVDPIGDGTVLFEHRIIRRDGSLRWVQLMGQVEFEGEGNSRRAVRQRGVMLDITERKRDEERLRQSQKLESVGLLAGGIAHDFNNLLTGIMGYASLALDEVPEAAVPGIREVIAAAEKAALLTRQLLAYSGKGQFVLKDIDLSQAVQEIADLAQFSIPKSVQLSLNLEKRLPTVRMDPGQLQQVLMNLLINAGEAIGTGSPGRITVTTSMRSVDREFTDARGEQVIAGRYVCIEISDTGAGMDEKRKDRIFDPFFTTKFTGRGLGLAAVAGILRSVGGGVTVESQLGIGTSFCAFLPVAESRVAGIAPLRPGTLGTVLVVDDESTVRDFISATLVRDGYKVLFASDGREALEICESHENGSGRKEIDAVVLDVIMPTMGAVELVPILKRLRPEVRILLTSGHSPLEVRGLTAAYPGLEFIEKPYTAQQIATAVNKLMGVTSEGRSSAMQA